MPPTWGHLWENLSATSVDGVMGYPPKNRQPAASAPSAQAWSPSRKCDPVSTPLGSAFNLSLLLFPLDHKDGEIGTQHLAQLTMNTGFFILDLRRMITLGVEFLGHLQDVPGAIFDAESASLTAVLDDVDLTMRNLHPIAIQWFSPVFHELTSPAGAEQQYLSESFFLL
jgi:hypothetical protein